MNTQTQIFESIYEFLERTDIIINGVSKEFALKFPNYMEMNQTNTGCWNCEGCTNCNYCSKCRGSHDCLNCTNCTYCSECKDCTNCRGSHYCLNCTNCQKCFHCNSIKDSFDYFKNFAINVF